MAFPAAADEWPQWFGPNRDGILREKGIQKKFSKEETKILWRKPIGGGYVGPVVANGKLFVMDRPPLPTAPAANAKDAKSKAPKKADKERVICLDAATGEQIWVHEYTCKYKVSYDGGPRASAIIDGQKVYALGAMGDLWCLNAANGKVLWERHFLKDYKLKQAPAWGWSSPPLIDGDALICLVGGDDTAVVAFDKNTGKELWHNLTTEEICYAPPVIIDHAGKRELLIWHSDAIAGLEPKTGKQIWTVPYPVDGQKRRPEVAISQPRQIGDRLFFTSFYQGSLMLKLGQEKADVAWKTIGAIDPMNADGLLTVMCTPVIKDEHIYGVCGFGELRCLDARTGKRVWETYQSTSGKKALFAHAFIIPHEDRFIMFNDLGDLISCNLTPKGYEELSRVHLIDPTTFARGRVVVWCHPAFANQKMFVRNEKEIICVDLAEKKA